MNNKTCVEGSTLLRSSHSYKNIPASCHRSIRHQNGAYAATKRQAKMISSISFLCTISSFSTRIASHFLSAQASSDALKAYPVHVFQDSGRRDSITFEFKDEMHDGMRSFGIYVQSILEPDRVEKNNDFQLDCGAIHEYFNNDGSCIEKVRVAY
ncbi:unnamed protein product [Somion occarium]|uniref:Uncharacterized protein n=1 Tax=Somion occarium TaxID=3059160 RepID=A0ABP1CQQ1_9APHY